MDTFTRFRAFGPLAFAIVAVALVLSAGPTAATPEPQEKTIGAVTLAVAVRGGQAKMFEGYTVTGEGRSFDTNCTPADPTKKIEASIPLGLGFVAPDGKPQSIVSLEDWVNYQMVGRQMLMVKLRGADLKIKPEPDPAHPVLYTFTAKFTGITESVTPPASILDNNPKPYTIAVLVETIAK